MLELKLLNSLNKIWINFNYHILCHDFLDVTPVKKKKKVKLKFIRIKKNTTKKVKKTTTELGTIIANYISDKGFVFRIPKELLQLHNKDKHPI